MAALPAPGQAALSPALHEITLDNPDLAARYPDHLVLSEEAVATGGTLLAYVGAPGRTRSYDERFCNQGSLVRF